MRRSELRKALLDANCLGLHEVNLRFQDRYLEEVLDKYFPKKVGKR